jgi:2'-5' RNA ligase
MLYFIAIIPPQNICDEITILKEDIRLRFNSKHALRTIPHITLKAPFKISADQHQQVIEWFGNMQITISSFQQKLKDFDVFDNKRNPVIFIKPMMNDSLKHLQQQVLENFKTAFPYIPLAANETKFHPHITIAYRDLSYTNFSEAWKEYASNRFVASFEVKAIHLLQHDGKRWNVIKQLVL